VVKGYGGKESTPDEYPIPPPAGAGIAAGADFVLIQIVKLAQDTGSLSTRLSQIEATQSGILKTLEKLEPQIAKVAGFVDHSQPHLATKDDLSKVKTDLVDQLNDRPSKTWIITLIGIVLAVIGLPFWTVWWDHVKNLF
jgi:hypothetical protein